MKKVLLIAFHFPPLVGSSGYQRALRLAQYLPEFGWEPTVLTVRPSAYPADEVDHDSERLVPAGCRVVRVPCLNAATHLSVRGRYLGRLAIPDRWASWSLLGRHVGVQLCRTEGIEMIWSTYPIATAHRIAAHVSSRTGLPWVADFRDPMMDEVHPQEPVLRASLGRIEAAVANTAAAVLFTAPSAEASFRRRYPEVPDDCIGLLENGYDEETFSNQPARSIPVVRDTPPVIVHSGIVYPVYRNPQPLFSALRELKRQGRIGKGDFVLRFRAAVHEDMLRSLAEEYSISEFIQVVGPVPYGEAIAEMLSSDGLLLLQAKANNKQIPAKLYEYLRAQRPILALATPDGDTGRRLSDLGFPFVVPLESEAAIREMFLRYLGEIRLGQGHTLSREAVRRFSRWQLAKRLAGVFDRTSG